MEIPLIALGIIIGAALAYFFLRTRFEAERQLLRVELLEEFEARIQGSQARLIQSYETRIQILQEEHSRAIASAQRDSTDQSRAVLKGKMAEQMAPMLPGFDYWPADARFLGDPIDYVVFSGYSQGNGAPDQIEIVILDIKKEQTPLSQGQRRIARAIAAGRVRFEVVRVFEDGTVKRHEWGKREEEEG